MIFAILVFSMPPFPSSTTRPSTAMATPEATLVPTALLRFTRTTASQLCCRAHVPLSSETSLTARTRESRSCSRSVVQPFQQASTMSLPSRKVSSSPSFFTMPSVLKRPAGPVLVLSTPPTGPSPSMVSIWIWRTSRRLGVSYLFKTSCFMMML